MIVCTISTANSLHKAKVMAASVKEQHPQAKVVMGFVEEDWHYALDTSLFDTIVLSKHLDILHFYTFMFKYWVYEGATSIKPFIMQYAMQLYPEEQHFIFLDADTKLYHPLDELVNALDRHEIVLTAQQLQARQAWERIIRLGVYNTGVFGLRRSDEAWRFVKWWGDRLYNYCFSDEPHYVDQRWIDLAPAYFNVHLFKHPGYNVAAWNIHEQDRRDIALYESKPYVGQRPLCCFHYSGLEGFLQSCMRQALPDNQTLPQLLNEYEHLLEQMGRSQLQSEPWSYDYYTSGEAIHFEVRLKCKWDPQLALRGGDNPFTASNRYFI